MELVYVCVLCPLKDFCNISMTFFYTRCKCCCYMFCRTLAHIMREMVQTERDYVLSLQYVIENYIPELQRPDVPQALRGKGSIIFGNIEKIYQFHRQYFLREVERCERNPFQISHYFLMHVSQSLLLKSQGFFWSPLNIVSLTMQVYCIYDMIFFRYIFTGSSVLSLCSL